MARLFDITPASDIATVEAGGSTRVVFTVSNTSQKPQRASLRIKPIDSTQADWLSVGGDVERDFPPGFTHQVEATFKVPAGTPSGAYRFRLDAVSTANTDDDLVQGPAVSVTVKPGTIPAPKKSLWWVWVLVGLLVLIIIGVVTWLLLRNKSEAPAAPPSAASAPQQPPSAPAKEAVVPNGLTGLAFNDAKKQLEALGFTVKRENKDIVDDCPDKVLNSNPTPGVTVLVGSPITLMVGALASGPETCKPGFVWREAFGGDTVCVTGDSRARAAQDNQANASRVELVPGTAKDFEEIHQSSPQAKAVAKGDFAALARLDSRIIFNPNLPRAIPMIARCKAGYFERRARPMDRVCVAEATQLATAEENQQAESRKACLVRK